MASTDASCVACGVESAVTINGARLHFGCVQLGNLPSWTSGKGSTDASAPLLPPSRALAATLDLGILDPLLDRLEEALSEPDAQAGRMDAERTADQLAWQAVALEDWNEGAYERAARATEPEDADDEPEAAPEALTLDWTAP